MVALVPDTGAETGLSADAVRRIQALARWRKRSELVHFYRRALPAAMVALVLFGLGWIAVRALISLGLGGEGVGTIHLLHPTFYGRNERGERYVLRADEAIRAGDNPDRIALTRPRLWEYTTAPQPETVSSATGVYHEKEKLLDLFGHVKASDGNGNHFASETAYVNMRRNSVVGQTAAFASGPQGTISASSYAVYDKGQHVIFTGNVHTHLVNNPGAKSGPARPAPLAPAR
ncbi:MAG: LPS export ABC transporter periplasmic protein LptC [Caulobacteraceae bacterium]